MVLTSKPAPDASARTCRRTRFHRLALLALALCLTIAPAGCLVLGPGPGPTPTPTGEIWRWAQGMAWDDPAIAAYTQDFGRHAKEWGDDPTGHVQAQGFALNLDASGRVRSVTVYADEASLGLGAGYAAYRGSLPLGLNWSQTATQVYAALGDPESITGGFGLPVVWTYRQDGLRMGVGFVGSGASGPPERLSPAARLHHIEVSPA